MAGCSTIFAAAIPSPTACCNCPTACAPAAGITSSPPKALPRKLVHKIETAALATLPGSTSYYAGHQELQTNLKKLLAGAKKIAMQYSPLNQIPYVAMVDAGTIEQVRKCGAKIFSSADLVQKYEACWTPEQLASHKKAGAAIDRITADAFELAAKSVREKENHHRIRSPAIYSPGIRQRGNRRR